MAAVSERSDPSTRSISYSRTNSHTYCNFGRVTCIFGAGLVVTGVALFILQNFYGHTYASGGIASMTLGGCLFFSGLIANGCASLREERAMNAAAALRMAGLDQQEDFSSLPSTDPIPFETYSTEAFFASKGVFGLPQDLIKRIDRWRRYRLNPSTPRPKALTLPPGILLAGTQGTGKSTIARHLGELLGGEFLTISQETIDKCLVGQTAEAISNLFRIPEGRFRILFFDEASAFFTSRLASSEHARKAVDQFLHKLDGAKTHPNYLVVATTNFPEIIDKAIAQEGRLGEPIVVGYPTNEARKLRFQFLLNDENIQIDCHTNAEELAGLLAEATEGFSCSELDAIASSGIEKAFYERRELKLDDFDIPSSPSPPEKNPRGHPRFADHDESDYR